MISQPLSKLSILESNELLLVWWLMVGPMTSLPLYV